MKNFIAALFLSAFFSLLHANPVILSGRLNWNPASGETSIPTFTGAVHADEAQGIPYYLQSFALEANPGRLQVRILRTRFEAFEWKNAPEAAVALGEQLQVEAAAEQIGSVFQGKLAFVPIVRRGGRFERLLEFEFQIEPADQGPVTFRGGPDNTRNSALSQGQLFRIAVTQTGLHRMNYTFLKNELGIDIDRIDPKKIQLFGNGGAMLPEKLGLPREDDLVENHIQIVGEEDGRFDASDYILFYAQGPDVWTYDQRERQFNQQKNIYDTRSYYFIRIGNDNGRRLPTQPSVEGGTYTATAFDDFARFEEDKLNLLHEWRPLTQGADRRWYNVNFRNQREYSFNDLFTFPNIETTEPVRVKVEMALRATRSSRFTVDINGRSLSSSNALAIPNLSDNEDDYADTATVRSVINLDRPDVDVVVRYPRPVGGNDGSEGWLDYIQLNVRRRLIMTGDQLAFRDTRTLGLPNATFRLEGATDRTVVWDISDPLRPVIQEAGLAGGVLSFGAGTNELRTFLAFRSDASFPAPIAAGKVENQNLHGLDDIDMVIITPADFASEAQRLADHRSQFSKLQVAVVRIDQLFNEFSSGRQDPTAIRDFARMLFDRNRRFRYLLLFGDGSFDYRDIYKLGNNFIPVYETSSFNPIIAFPSDDYYTLLNDDHPTNPLSGTMDIAIGRLPVKNLEECQGVVNKIIHYETNQPTLSDWRNRLLFVGDDEDGMMHTIQAEQIADTIARRYPSFNIDKVYLDAFPQVATQGVPRFPAATEALAQSVFRGVLAITYLGHGGSAGLAQERVLEIPDLLNWRNFDKPPLLVTATCSFAGYDDPSFTTAGETAILNGRGGAIALMTTVRAVYSSLNAALTMEAMRTMFERIDGRTLTMGEVMVRSKNRLTGPSILTNSRKFTLLGDPAMHLAIPEYQVVTTKINTRDAQGPSPDTLRALQRVTIEGEVLDLNGRLLDGFNGVLYPTIFDKSVLASTLGQDRDSYKLPFDLQKNIIFKGRATVRNGRFQFSFVIPKDINYTFGKGKISYYAADEQSRTDAGGAFGEVIIGGADTQALADRKGPNVDVFMNTEDFAFGGITDENPTLLVRLADENGINVVGNSIGHDLEAILDEDTQNSLLLNDFYESDLDDYTKGRVRYPLSKLAEGRHTLRVKAWDVANNSSEGYTEFVVAGSGKIALEHVLNYPNPFTDRTCFQFDHNMANQEIEVLIHIYTISGRLVKTLEQVILSDGAIRRDDCIEWDGRDEFGDILARGVYLYRVKVRTRNTGNAVLEGESQFEKLVLLK